jgi:ADP-ribose pyrophosphatase YjhB (NUDIX family)
MNKHWANAEKKPKSKDDSINCQTSSVTEPKVMLENQRLSSPKKGIDKLGWCFIKDNRLLVARSHGKDKFYIPGGKRETGESDREALIREIKEELSIDLIPESIRYFGTFKDQAHGQPPGIYVTTTCYLGDYTGEIKASSEIEETTWLSYRDREKCSSVTQMVIDQLKSEGKL